jgi:hypothetical protein
MKKTKTGLMILLLLCLIGMTYGFWSEGINPPDDEERNGNINTGTWAETFELEFHESHPVGGALTILRVNIKEFSYINFGVGLLTNYAAMTGHNGVHSTYFAGWFMDASFTIPAPAYMPSRNLRLFARWIAMSETPAHMFNFVTASRTITGFSATWDGRLDLVIPSHIGGIAVNAVQGFANRNLNSVSIPNGVTIIGTDGFAGNNLRNLVLPNSITTINNRAFRNNQLQNLTLSSNLSTTGIDTFQNNQLSSIVIPNNVTEIGTRSFQNNNLVSINFGNVTTIGVDGFAGNKLESLVIPGHVRFIGIRAFQNNRLRNVTLTNGIETIGSDSFRGSDLRSLLIPVSVTNIGVRIIWHNHNFERVYYAGTESQWNLITRDPITISIERPGHVPVVFLGS